MLSREVAYALSVRARDRTRALARPRSAAGTALRIKHRDAGPVGAAGAARCRRCPRRRLRMTVRHAIMQVNYYVRVRTCLRTMWTR